MHLERLNVEIMSCLLFLMGSGIIMFMNFFLHMFTDLDIPVRWFYVYVFESGNLVVGFIFLRIYVSFMNVMKYFFASFLQDLNFCINGIGRYNRIYI